MDIQAQKAAMKTAVTRLVLGKEMQLRQKYEDYAWKNVTADIFERSINAEKETTLYEAAKESGAGFSIPSQSTVLLPDLPKANKSTKLGWCLKVFAWDVFLWVVLLVLPIILAPFVQSRGAATPLIFMFAFAQGALANPFTYFWLLVFSILSVVFRINKVHNCAAAFVRAFEDACVEDINRFTMQDVSQAAKVAPAAVSYVPPSSAGASPTMNAGNVAPTPVTAKKVYEPVLGVETDALIKRANLFLEDGNFEEADRYFEQAVNQDPENYRVYIGKLMVEKRVRTLDNLAELSAPLDEEKLFQRALRFSTGEDKERLEAIAQAIRDRSTRDEAKKAAEAERKRAEKEADNERIYVAALKLKACADTVKDFQYLIDVLKAITPYKDTESLIKEVEAHREQQRKYERALELKGLKPKYANLRELVEKFEELGDYRDAPALLEEAKAALTKAKKKRNRIFAIIAAVIVSLLLGIGLKMWRDSVQRVMREAYKKGENYYAQKDYQKAVEQFRKAAESGNADAQNYLGWMYHNGYGVPQDYKQAVEWYRKAVEKGHSSAQNNLGWMYQNGFGVQKDYNKAIEWYRKAVEQRNADAQNNLDAALLFLCQSGTAQQVSDAIKAGANANAKYENDMTALMVAAFKNENPDVFTALINGGADVNAKNENGWTALMMAAFQNENPEVIAALVKGGADINAKSKNGMTAADVARWKNNTAVLKLLEEAKNAPVHKSNKGAMSDGEFLKLCESGTAQQVADAIKAGANVKAKDKSGSTVLMRAAFKNETPDVFTALINGGADVNATMEDEFGMTALMVAAFANKNPDVFTALINGGADVNAKDKNGITALIYAARANETPEFITTLISAGADVNVKDKNGCTALIHAARANENSEVITTLIRSGADVNAKDKRGYTALMGAAGDNKNPEVLTALINAGADVNAKDENGATALMWAAGNNKNPEVLTVLINSGADVNAKDKNGITALMWAAGNNKNPEVLTTLINAGTDVNAKDNNGATALDVARKQNNTAALKILEEAKNAAHQGRRAGK